MKNHLHRLQALWAASLVVLCASTPFALPATDARPPGKMAFQGFLTDGSGEPRGKDAPVNLNLTFRIYKSSSGGEAVWAEVQTVTVDKGHFSLLLGEGTGVPGSPYSANLAEYFTGPDNDLGRYLGITVEGEAEISPRIQFLSAPYAHLARYANELVGSSGSSLLRTGNGVVGINLEDGVTPASTLQVNGTVTAEGFSGSGAGLADLNGGELVDGSVGRDQIAGNAVTSQKIADGTIVDADIAASAAISGAKLSPQVALLNRQNQTFNTQVNIKETAANASALRLLDFGDTERALLGLARRVGDWSTWAEENDVVLRATTGNLLLQSQTHGGSAITIDTQNRVGVGTYSPDKGKLHVEGGINRSGITGAYINGSKAGDKWTHGEHPISIYTSGSIWCGNTVIASSDARIKNIDGRSDSGRDLGILRRIQVTDFRYKDTIAFGSDSNKKAIAQQIETIFPQAVHRHTDTVPDIYETATVHDGWVRLTTDLSKGERVRLITEKTDVIHEVLEVAEGKFRTDLSGEANEVFVYGREVNDFRTVDYDAIAMLNVSATQELARQVDALRQSQAQVAELRDRVTRLETVERELAELRQAISRLARRPAEWPSSTGERGDEAAHLSLR